MSGARGLAGSPKPKPGWVMSSAKASGNHYASGPGWVSDDTIKHLETFVTGPIKHDTAVLPFPTKPTDPNGSTHGGAA